jgi:deoxyribonuclease V
MKTLFLDVKYNKGKATVGCVLVDELCDKIPKAAFTIETDVTAPYMPGQFYIREMPPLIKAVEMSGKELRVLVIDGYVWLDKGKPGLGAHLYEHFKGRYLVIGIAKRPFTGNRAAIEVFRGESRRPLWVTSMGMDAHVASDIVSKLPGKFRIPSMVKRADQLSKGG